MNEFLLEIFTEEIPARMQLQAADNLKKILRDELTARDLFEGSMNDAVLETYVTPRRLVAFMKPLVAETPSTREERRGPKIDAPLNALEGFKRSLGVDITTQRDGYHYAHIETKAQKTRDVLTEIIEAVFAQMVWPKSMRWSLNDEATPRSSQYWIRPVRSVLAVFGKEALMVHLPTLGITTGNQTQGHRFLSPTSFSVDCFDDYRSKLEKAFVILDHQDRQARIWEGLEAQAHQHHLVIKPDDELLKEVAGLVEYPVPLLGKIEAQFMSLPEVVLSTAMRVHQKYFTVVDQNNKIAPYFGVVSNNQAPDGGLKMIAGYERVLRARLSDAAFFYHHDLNSPLENLTTKLKGIVFHAKLGTVGQKIDRLIQVMTTPEGKRAAQLAKADLLTTMVGEFPELQGIMGALYATAQSETAEVATAIQEHYQPLGPNDDCPTAPLSVELALADKIDTLVGFFGIGQEPTGSKDPFALRRAALGIIRLIRENKLSGISLKSLCDQASQAYQTQGIVFEKEFTCEKVVSFLNERLKVALRSEGIRHDCVTAVLDSQLSSANSWVIAVRAKALQDFLDSVDGAALLSAFRRAYGILAEEQKKDHILYTGKNVSTDQFMAIQETNLYQDVSQIMSAQDHYLASHNYEGLMTQFASLRPTVDAFFDLKVNHEDSTIRLNRLELLGLLIAQTEKIADFSKIEG